MRKAGEQWWIWQKLAGYDEQVAYTIFVFLQEDKNCGNMTELCGYRGYIKLWRLFLVGTLDLCDVFYVKKKTVEI